MFLDKTNDRGIIASHLLSPLINLVKPEYPSQFKLLNNTNSDRVNDLLMNKTIPVTLHDNLFTFSKSNKKFEFTG